MQKPMQYAVVAGILLMLTIAGVWMTTNNASAQGVSASFNPQTQFPVGSTLTITSVYGIATVPSHPFNASSMPGLLNRNGTQNLRNHDWNQTSGNHKGIHPTWNQTMNHSWNQTFMNHNWNGTLQQYSATYSTSVTISAQVTNDTANGGIQWTVQGGSIVVNGSTFTITGGKGEMSNIDRLTLVGTATDANGQTFRWQLQGLAAMYNGAVIAELNGGSFAGVNSAFARANLTYIATIS